MVDVTFDIIKAGVVMVCTIFLILTATSIFVALVNGMLKAVFEKVGGVDYDGECNSECNSNRKGAKQRRT